MWTMSFLSYISSEVSSMIPYCPEKYLNKEPQKMFRVN